MANQIELTLDAAGERLDRALSEAHPDVSRMQWQRLIKEGQVRVNGEVSTKASLKLSGGETISAEIPPPAESTLIAEEIPLDIRYEDDDMLIINKPAGMVVHPAVGHESGTLANAVLGYLPDLVVGDAHRPGIVHRLDKDTSGLIVVAKNDHAMQHLQAQFKERTVSKTYLALVNGHVQPPAALIDAPIGRDPLKRKQMSVIVPGSPRANSANARPAQTQYEARTFYDEYTLVECDLLTGRTHQIRVHLAYIGYPIVGDTVYGRRKQPLLKTRHFLHAAAITIRRPSDGEMVSISAELPPELQTILDQLEEA